MNGLDAFLNAIDESNKDSDRKIILSNNFSPIINIQFPLVNNNRQAEIEKNNNA